MGALHIITVLLQFLHMDAGHMRTQHTSTVRVIPALPYSCHLNPCLNGATGKQPHHGVRRHLPNVPVSTTL